MAFTRTSDPPYSSALATLIPVVWRWSVKKFFFLIKLQAETLTRVFSCQLSKIFRNIFFYRKPLVADFSRNIITSGFVFMVWRTKTAIHSTGVLKHLLWKILQNHRKTSLSRGAFLRFLWIYPEKVFTELFRVIILDKCFFVSHIILDTVR